MMYYLLPIVAVLSGFVFVLIVKPKQKANIKLLLAFSGAFLLSLTVFDLLPEVYKENSKQTGIFIMAGIILQIVLEFFSKGAEHGHVHLHKNQRHFPWVLFISLSIHSIIEGFSIHQYKTLIYGIFIHHLPIAIMLTVIFIESNMPKAKVAAFLIIFSIMTPLGTFLSEHLTFLKSYAQQISALVIGVLLHISTIILFESSAEHKFNSSKLVVILIGIATAYFL